MNADDLAHLTLVEAADAVASGAARSTDLLQACLDRIDRAEAQINAIVEIDRDGAYAAAEKADAERRVGRPAGPLHGVPIVHKDMFYKAGQLTECGSRIRKGFRSTDTATVFERLEAAGGYSFARMNMSEFALGGTGHNVHVGDCRNPWQPQFVSGGSSSGCAAALAARFAFGALGSDTGGSIRVPASACGVTGIKPTHGRVSRWGAMPLSYSLDTVGPLARTARDCARLLSVLAGPDEKDPTTSRRPVPDYEGLLTGDLRGVRIGVPTNALMTETDDAILRLVDDASQVLRSRGADVSPVRLPLVHEIATCSSIVAGVEIAAIHANWLKERPQDYSPYVSSRMYASLAVPGPVYLKALAQRGALLSRFCDEVFSGFDLFLSPTLPIELPTGSESDAAGPSPGALEKQRTVLRNTRWINYLGLPSMTVPCGFDTNGLPAGLQITGTPFGEGLVLRAGDAFQQDTAWHGLCPAIAEAGPEAAIA